MVFKKLHPYIKEKLASLDITTPTLFQTKSIPLIKSGANVYCFAPENSGKTTTLILTTLHKLQCEEAGSAPRAIILVENNVKAGELYDAFISYTRHSTLRVYYGDEREHIDLLKSEIFEGIDVLIATPKIVNKLLLLEGLNTTQVKIFHIDDASFLSEKSAYAALIAITQSIHKCQYVIYADKIEPNLKKLQDYFMQFAKTISIK
ncbi:DEAD/DEAH box helicase [uncultured Polaribacter sp.]|uniref:DEAD/DEAH box helicase n=1 Tax=uncultured Polaribacter sp. TaxID=174711 RepID=UPI002603A112|nr:DEAD/DEAH box helicase [uncultured Polaribacter sp.]